MLAEYMQEERRCSALERTLNKREQSGPKNSRGLNRFMACQPHTYSPILYNSSLAAHMLTVLRQVQWTSNRRTTTDICSCPYINQSFNVKIIKQLNHSTKLQMASLVWTVSDYSYNIPWRKHHWSTSPASHLAQSQKQQQQSWSAFW